LTCFVIADLSNIWIQAEVYEYENPIGQPWAEKRRSLSCLFRQGPSQGKVTYISPEMDPKTRTLKIRVELANPDFKIKPDMYANVELKTDYGKKTFNSSGGCAGFGGGPDGFIAKEGGYFEPRKITVGPHVDGRLIVLDGLKAESGW